MLVVTLRLLTLWLLGPLRPSVVAPPVTAEWVRLDPPGAGPLTTPVNPPTGVVPFLHSPCSSHFYRSWGSEEGHFAVGCDEP
jgi:hypothetical protein